MVVAFTVECEIPIAAATFWRVRSHPDFLDHLVDAKALRRVAYTPVSDASEEEAGAPDHKTRTLTYVPKNESIPEMAFSVIGDGAFELQDKQIWTENGQGQAGKYELKFGVSSSSAMLKDIVTTDGKMRLEELAPSEDTAERAKHFVDVEVAVNVFGIGGFLESAIQDNMHTFYEEYPAVVKSFKDKVIECVGEESAGCSFEETYKRYEAKRAAAVAEGCGDTTTVATET